MENTRLLEIIKSAILLELRGESFYRKVAESSDNQGIKNIFDIMAKEEVLHAKILREKYAQLTGQSSLSAVELPADQDE